MHRCVRKSVERGSRMRPDSGVEGSGVRLHAYIGSTTTQDISSRNCTDDGYAVTGGTGTLALHCARALLEHGLSTLTLWDVAPSPSQVSEIAALQAAWPDRRVTLRAVDVTDEAAVVAAAAAAGGRVDHLLCFAGVVSTVPTLAASAAEFRRVMAVNLEGGFLCSREVGKYVSEKPGFLFGKSRYTCARLTTHLGLWPPKTHRAAQSRSSAARPPSFLDTYPSLR